MSITEQIVRPKCKDCPLLSDPDHACPGQTRTFHRYCELVSPEAGPNSEGYRRIVVERARHKAPDFSMPKGRVNLSINSIGATNRLPPPPPGSAAVLATPMNGTTADSSTAVMNEESPEMKRTSTFDLQKIVAKVERCPYRGARSDCKCNGYRKCAKGRGRRGDVTLNNCIDCIAAGGP